VSARALVVAGLLLAVPGLSAGQAVSTLDREAMVRQRVERGGRPEEVDRLLRLAEDAAAQSLPVAPITNKIREGLAKGADPQRIDAIVRQMVANLGSADALARELTPGASAAERRAAVVLLAESLDGGVTADDVREMRVAAGVDGSTSLDRLASSAKGLSMIRAARLPSADGRLVMAEAMRRGYRNGELVDLGRDVKRREQAFQAGRASLRALRDAIARGDRPEQLFRDVPEETASRPAARPDAVRPEAERPAPVRPEAARPERPAVPERPTTPERPTAPERPGR
jgi:hypothetical protein